MKTVSTLLVLSALVALSCRPDEEPTFCYECTTEVMEGGPTGHHAEYEEKEQVCGMTESQADKYEEKETSSGYVGAIYIIRTTTCVKKK